jgi:hypothetical protein
MVRNYGASWGDYDKDGDLDVYICKYHNPSVSEGYEFTNHLYQNNGDGTFTDVTTDAGVGDGIKASFQSIFFDYNNDGWEDIYVINDRLSFANSLFHNNGDGSFTDVSEASGADVVMDAMTVSVADYDRDEDFDIFISDTYTNRLLQNNGDGTFSDVAEEMGLLIPQESWSALWMDYNNDMTEDLHVAAINNVGSINYQNYFFESQGSSFTCVHNNIGLEYDDFGTFSTAMGDINNDGYGDFVENNQDTAPCQLWKSSGGDGHWLKVDLSGVLSNTNGVGSLIKCFTGNVVQSRYVHLGEAYLSQASNREMLGLGDNETADSLYVFWPSGIVDKFYSVEANQTIHIEEGETFSTQIISNGQNGICPGDSVLLSVSNGDGFVWSNGQTIQSQWVSEAGEYYADVVLDGISISTDTIEISYLPPPAIQATVEDVSCNGGDDGSILLTNQNGFGVDQVIWNIGINGEFIDGLSAQNYQYTFFDSNRCQAQGLVTVGEPSALEVSLEVENQNEAEDGSAVLSISGGVLPYSIYWSNGDSNAIFVADLLPGEYEVEVIDANGCSELLNFTIDEYIGIEEWSESREVTIYPNPFQSQINIESKLPLKGFTVTSVTGAVIQKKSFRGESTSQKEILNLSELSSGIYFLSIDYFSGNQKFKVIKN